MNQEELVSPTEMADTFLTELNLALEDCNNSLNDAHRNQEELMLKYEQLIEEQRIFDNEALKESNKGNDQKSKVNATKSAALEDQIGNYKLLLVDVCNTIYLLEKQVGTIKLKIDKTKAQQMLMKAKLKQAESQVKISEELMLMENSEEFRELEETLKDAEAKAEALAYLSGEHTEIDKVLAAEFDFDAHIESRREKDDKQDEHRMKVILGRVFQKEQDTKVDHRFKQALNDKLTSFRTNTVLSTQEKLLDMNSFFLSETKHEESIDDKTKSFFENETNINTSELDAKIDTFFREEETDQKTRKLNDFFREG